jgi:CrcB protein
MHTLSMCLCIAAGGAAGAVCRWLLSEFVQNRTGAGFAWGTWTVNLLGCFLIGVAFHLVPLAFVPNAAKFLVITGFLGAFTTFSTFSLETLDFLRDGAYATAGLYIMSSNVLGVGICAAGWALGHWVHALLR